MEKLKGLQLIFPMCDIKVRDPSKPKSINKVEDFEKNTYHDQTPRKMSFYVQGSSFMQNKATVRQSSQNTPSKEAEETDSKRWSSGDTRNVKSHVAVGKHTACNLKATCELKGLKGPQITSNADRTTVEKPRRHVDTFDKYGNHMKKDEHIKVVLEGLHLLDKGDSLSKATSITA
ncbi:hypothetical protein RND71_018170 [Anisodus tanguticus]|uniref:Uncharacterized protein n=1 Tax=Anisodus tanguticus TaxID=243964 RepID=A0AAE1S4W4_9SOLA|nr:hypothetical protein RND71_018170 [Anisodus tanguticus]